MRAVEPGCCRKKAACCVRCCLLVFLLAAGWVDTAGGIWANASSIVDEQLNSALNTSGLNSQPDL